jgi:hypothetical protein
MLSDGDGYVISSQNFLSLMDAITKAKIITRYNNICIYYSRTFFSQVNKCENCAQINLLLLQCN